MVKATVNSQHDDGHDAQYDAQHDDRYDAQPDRRRASAEPAPSTGSPATRTTSPTASTLSSTTPAASPTPTPPASRRRLTADRAWGIVFLVAGIAWLLVLLGGIRIESGTVFFGLVTLVLTGLFLSLHADGLLVAATQTGAMALFIQIVPFLERMAGDLVAPVFFGSFGLGFGLVYLLRRRTCSWAVYPALALLGFGVFLWTIISDSAGGYALPVVLIVTGVLLFVLSFRRSGSGGGPGRQ